MISNKHIAKFSAILVLIVFVICILSQLYPDTLSSFVTDTAYSMEYTDKLFDTDKIIDVNIKMDGDKWQEMLENAMKEEYCKCDAEINGELFYSVGIRPKGNTSLSQVANDPDNDRYSFKLEFDRFVEGQTCFGLDKLILNSNYADKTNMKEAVIYDMFAFIGADASLYNYAKISVNNNYWGVYLALEAVEESFILRNYGAENGKLYKPDSMNFGGRKDNNERTSQTPGAFPGGKGGPGFGGNGTNLNYTDDNPDSYSAIWEGSVNGSRDADRRRVVTALKNVGEGTNAEKYLDIDNLVKYMAVHNFAVNEDSLSGGMAHNYYLYEANGRLNIIPWDYNLSWGGMGIRGGSGADSVINDAVDDSYSSTDFFDILLKDEEYLSLYHSCYKSLIEGYVNSGKFEETYNRITGQIDELVKDDPNAMYSYDEYTNAKDILYNVIMLRAKSVSGQLDGIIPATSEGQQNTPDALIDASSVDLSAMGSMGGGFGRVNRAESGDNDD